MARTSTAREEEVIVPRPAYTKEQLDHGLPLKQLKALLLDPTTYRPTDRVDLVEHLIDTGAVQVLQANSLDGRKGDSSRKENIHDNHNHKHSKSKSSSSRTNTDTSGEKKKKKTKVSTLLRMSVKEIKRLIQQDAPDLDLSSVKAVEKMDLIDFFATSQYMTIRYNVPTTLTSTLVDSSSSNKAKTTGGPGPWTANAASDSHKAKRRQSHGKESRKHDCTDGTQEHTRKEGTHIRDEHRPDPPAVTTPMCQSKKSRSHHRKDDDRKSRNEHGHKTSILSGTHSTDDMFDSRQEDPTETDAYDDIDEDFSSSSYSPFHIISEKKHVPVKSTHSRFVDDDADETERTETSMTEDHDLSFSASFNDKNINNSYGILLGAAGGSDDDDGSESAMETKKNCTTSSSSGPRIQELQKSRRLSMQPSTSRPVNSNNAASNAFWPQTPQPQRAKRFVDPPANKRQSLSHIDIPQSPEARSTNYTGGGNSSNSHKQSIDKGVVVLLSTAPTTKRYVRGNQQKVLNLLNQVYKDVPYHVLDVADTTSCKRKSQLLKLCESTAGYCYSSTYDYPLLFLVTQPSTQNEEILYKGNFEWFETAHEGGFLQEMIMASASSPTTFEPSSSSASRPSKSKSLSHFNNSDSNDGSGRDGGGSRSNHNNKALSSRSHSEKSLRKTSLSSNSGHANTPTSSARKTPSLNKQDTQRLCKTPVPDKQKQRRKLSLNHMTSNGHNNNCSLNNDKPSKSTARSSTLKNDTAKATTLSDREFGNGVVVVMSMSYTTKATIRRKQRKAVEILNQMELPYHILDASNMDNDEHRLRLLNRTQAAAGETSEYPHFFWVEEAHTPQEDILYKGNFEWFETAHDAGLLKSMLFCVE